MHVHTHTHKHTHTHTHTHNTADYYIWHKGSCDKTAEAKRESVLAGGLWWLRDDWKEVTDPRPNVLGIEWLSVIANYSTLFTT